MQDKPTKQHHGLSAIDLGCGPQKKAEALGVDHYPYAGVDIVLDLNQTPWPLGSNLFKEAHASHVIEHIDSIPDFMREVHRICLDQAIVHITTPHFSSLDSWKDPTHRWHLAAEWHAPFCHQDKYLARQMPRFEVVSSKVSFSRSLRNIPGRVIYKLFGQKTWEKHHSFRYPAKNIYTVLRVVKTSPDEP